MKKTNFNSFKNYLLLGLILHLTVNSFAQNIGINATGATPDASALLDLDATDKGFLITRVDTANIASPAFGLMTLAPSDSCLYLFNGAKWMGLGSGGKNCNCNCANSSGTGTPPPPSLPASCFTVGGTGDDRAHSIIQTSDGGFAMAGETSSFGVGGDMYIVKLDAAGNISWTTTVGGANGEGAWSIIQTTDGGYAVSGYSFSFGSGSGDFYMVKLDATGGACASCNPSSGGASSSGGTSDSGGTSGSGGISGSGGTSGSGGVKTNVCN